ncbi:MAG: TraC family protein [Patescibacteria group bacterium]
MALFGPKQQVGSTQDALRFAEIRNDTIILKDGNLRQVLLCSSINFALKSEQEQNAIVYAYQNFLNSLNFPIQILMQSKKLDLSSYLAKLQEKANGQTNELLRGQTLDYIDFIKRLINLANIMDKRFYVVIPFVIPPKIGPTNPLSKKNQVQTLLSNEEFQNYKKELEQRIQVIESGLGSIGIRTAKLNTQQLIELLYGVYNPEEAHKEKLIDVENLTGEIVKSEIER